MYQVQEAWKFFFTFSLFCVKKIQIKSFFIKEKLCNFLVQTLQYYKKNAPENMKKPPTKVAHNRLNFLFFSTAKNGPVSPDSWGFSMFPILDTNLWCNKRQIPLKKWTKHSKIYLLFCFFGFNVISLFKKGLGLKACYIFHEGV